MGLLYKCERAIDRFGRALAWLVFLMMFSVCLVVLLRSGFKIGLIALQESIFYIHAIFFMLAVAYTLQADEHVRVDVFYQGFSKRKKAWVNALGCIVFLFPMCLFILLSSVDYVANSWHMREGSSEAGGLAYVYALKMLIPLMALSLMLQALVNLIHNIYFLMCDESFADSLNATNSSQVKT